MTKKCSTSQTFYYRYRSAISAILIGLCGLGLFYFGCNRSATSLYEVMFKTSPATSVNFRNSQDCYILDCCLWLHFTIDSSHLNMLLKEGFTQEKLNFGFGSVPPEAKNWWYPETLGENASFYTRKVEGARQGLYTNDSKNEVYMVHYFQ